MSRSGLSITKAEKALREHNGIVLKAAEACGVTRKTFYRFMEKHPHLQEVREEVDETLLDVAEAHVITDLHAGERKTIRWYLDRKGKDRGYTTRQEQTGRDGGPLEFGEVERVIVDPDEEEPK